ncbi:MAG: BspA family leucine-rich repeat surface protein [Sulfurimonas sp.]|nr:BspA family leucine-rich repeat surface protein [Sulfurimonas sp.]
MKKVNRATLIEMIKNNEDVTDVDTSGWEVPSVKDMSYMFSECVVFSQDISKRDVSSVEDMDDIFRGCEIAEENKPKFNR